MPIRHPFLVLYAASALCIALIGCKDHRWNLASVQGTLTQAGRPLAGVEVTFLPDADAGTQGPRATGVTDETGHYALHIDAGDSGAIVGKYRVCLFVPHTDLEENLPNEVVEKLLGSTVITLPLEYSNFTKTPLKAEVHAGAQTINFAVP